MLGDCYAAAVVEHLSKKELMALDAAVPYQDMTPVSVNGHVLIEGGQSNLLSKNSIPDSVSIEINTETASGCLKNGCKI